MSTRLHVRPALPLRHYRSGRSVEVRLAHLLGCGVGTAHQRLYGTRAVNVEFALACQAFLDAGYPERLESWSAGARQAMTHRPLRTFNLDLVLRAQQADADEDLAETLFHANPTPENRDSWIRHLRREAALLTEEADALEAGSRTVT